MDSGGISDWDSRMIERRTNDEMFDRLKKQIEHKDRQAEVQQERIDQLESDNERLRDMSDAEMFDRMRLMEDRVKNLLVENNHRIQISNDLINAKARLEDDLVTMRKRLKRQRAECTCDPMCLRDIREEGV